MIAEMVKVDKNEALKEVLLRESGFEINSSNEQPPSI